MRKFTIRTVRAVIRVVNQILRTDLPMDMWLDEPFEDRR